MKPFSTPPLAIDVHTVDNPNIIGSLSSSNKPEKFQSNFSPLREGTANRDSTPNKLRPASLSQLRSRSQRWAAEPAMSSDSDCSIPSESGRWPMEMSFTQTPPNAAIAALPVTHESIVASLDSSSRNALPAGILAPKLGSTTPGVNAPLSPALDSRERECEHYHRIAIEVCRIE